MNQLKSTRDLSWVGFYLAKLVILGKCLLSNRNMFRYPMALCRLPTEKLDNQIPSSANQCLFIVKFKLK